MSFWKDVLWLSKNLFRIHMKYSAIFCCCFLDNWPWSCYNTRQHLFMSFVYHQNPVVYWESPWNCPKATIITTMLIIDFIFLPLAFHVCVSAHQTVPHFIHPSVLRCGHIGFLQNFTEKKGSSSVATSNQVTFKPSSFPLINVVNLSDPACTCIEICMGIGEIYRPQVKFSMIGFSPWISLNNSKCYRTFTDHPLRGHNFFLRGQCWLLWINKCTLLHR